MTKCVVVLSGGQDSTTCLFYALDQDFDVHAVTFDYGQRHRREIYCAKQIAKYAGVPHEIIEIGNVLKGTSPLVSDSELEQYSHYSVLPAGVEKTFVPMRNQLFLTIAANRAFVLGADVLFTGVSSEDYGGYPDCRPDFIQAFEAASSWGTFTDEVGFTEGLIVETPLMHMSKAETVRMALVLPKCYEALALTQTGYDGVYPPTGKDHATLLRQKGFEEAGVPDPLVIRAVIEGLMDYPNSINYAPKIVAPYYERIEEFLKCIQ
jgi:7-cyano-7-deazaguanine synthase